MPIYVSGVIGIGLQKCVNAWSDYLQYYHQPMTVTVACIILKAHPLSSCEPHVPECYVNNIPPTCIIITHRIK